MKKLSGKKTITDYLLLITGLLAFALAFVYRSFTLPYGIFSVSAFICIILVAVVNIALVFFSTKLDSYVQIISVVLAALALSLFMTDCVGTINDYINDVIFMGSGAPINGVFMLAAFMFIIVLANIAGCFLKKSNQ